MSFSNFSLHESKMNRFMSRLLIFATEMEYVGGNRKTNERCIAANDSDKLVTTVPVFMSPYQSSSDC